MEASTVVSETVDPKVPSDKPAPSPTETGADEPSSSLEKTPKLTDSENGETTPAEEETVKDHIDVASTAAEVDPENVTESKETDVEISPEPVKEEKVDLEPVDESKETDSRPASEQRTASPTPTATAPSVTVQGVEDNEEHESSNSSSPEALHIHLDEDKDEAQPTGNLASWNLSFISWKRKRSNIFFLFHFIPKWSVSRKLHWILS